MVVMKTKMRIFK